MNTWYTIPHIVSEVLGFLPQHLRIMVQTIITKRWKNIPINCHEIIIPTEITTTQLDQILQCTRSIHICTINSSLDIHDQRKIFYKLPNLHTLILNKYLPITTIMTCHIKNLIYNFGIYDGDVQHISNIKGLRQLNLQNCKYIRNDGLQYIFKITTLQRLSLYDCINITNDGFKNIVALKNLEELTIYANFITDEMCVHIAKLSFKLKYLNIGYGNITDVRLQHLSKITSLESFIIESYGISDEGLRYMAAFVNLRHLCIKGNIRGHGLKYLPYSLQSLDISEVGTLLDENLQYLCKYSLQRLDISYCYLTQLHFTSSLLNLQTLNIANFGVTINNFQYLSNLTMLKNLDIRDCEDLTDNELVHVGKIVSLTHLNINSCTSWVSITNDGIRNLCNLINLTNLDIAYSGMTNTGLEYICHLKTLKHLDIGGATQITDDGLVHLGNLSNLIHLDIYDVGITDIGLQHISHLKTLEYVDFELCYKLTNNGFNCMFKQLALTSLKIKYPDHITISSHYLYIQ